MRRPGPLDLGLVTVGVAVATVLVLWDPAAGFLEWVFGSVLFSLLAYVVAATVGSVRRARAARLLARRLAATEPGAVALEAIREERRRLADEIAAALREQVLAIECEVEQLDAGDPRPGLRRIHAHTQLATSELRRHLGLLREPETGPERVPGDVPVTGPPRRDVVLGAAMAALAVAEVTTYLALEGPQEWWPWSIVTSALAAACVVGRSAAPAAACAACAAVFAAGTVLGAPVTGGFWFFGTLGSLVWVVAHRARVPSAELVGGVLLVMSVGVTRSIDDPGNLPFVLVLMAVAATGGLVVRVAGWRERGSRERAAAREEELADAARAAVTAERAGFARELHDVTSHAIGLIAVQSAAAQVSWPHDQGAVRRSVALVEQTARSARVELDRLGAGRSAVRGTADLHRLAARIRASGTAVDLEVSGDLPAGVALVVHRVVQEALTNVVRHAAGAHVRVAVTSGPDGAVVSVRDDGLGPPTGSVRGYGLVGLSERVALAGGALHAGPGEDGGFLVEARLPVARQAVTP